MRILTALLLSAVSALSAYEPIEDKAAIRIENPALSEQKTEKIRLHNGLEAVIVSNPAVKQAAVNLVVKAGSLQDPDAHPGLAHFLEHMLFLGTEEFPKEMDFARFLSEHAGEMNAYTSSDYTSYQFSVSPSGLPEALQRFSSFYKNPLLSQSGTARELNAIDQEFEKGFNSEGKIGFQVLKTLISPLNPAHRFNSGNSKSLAKATPDDLRNWFETHYGPDRMRLYVLAPLPLEELVRMVDKDFSSIPERTTEPLNLDKELFDSKTVGSEVLVAIPKEIYELDIVWAIPPWMPLDLNNEPEDLIAYVLQNKGPKSLFSYLQAEGLAEEISSDTLTFSPKERIFELNIVLTEKGFRSKEEVLKAVFSTLSGMRAEPYPETLYKELALLKKQRYQFLEYETPFDWAKKQGEWLAREDISTYPERSLTLGKFDRESIARLLQAMTAENALYFLFAPEKAFGRKLASKEPWMEIPYEKAPMSKETLQRLSALKPMPEIGWNLANPWIAKTAESEAFSSKKELFPSLSAPVKVLDAPGALFYYAADELYALPRSYIKIEIQSPLLQEGKPSKAALADLYVKALEIELSELLYEAKMADSEIKLKSALGGIELVVEGFTESVLKLYPELVRRIIRADFSEEEFARAKEILDREYRNNLLEMPIQQTFDYLKGSLLEGYATNQQKKAVIRPISKDSLVAFSKGFFKTVAIKGVATGSLNENRAEELALITQSTLQKAQSKPAPLFYPVVRNIEECKAPCALTLSTKASGNAMLLILESAEFSADERNFQQMLSMAMWEAFFTELRTKQQTGYLVGSNAIDLYRRLFSYFAIQSTRYQPEELLWRSERFLEQYRERLASEEIPEERFEALKAALKARITEPPGSLKLFGELVYKLAFEVEDFSFLEKRLAALQKETYGDFLAYADRLLSRLNKRRLAILLVDKDAADPLRYTAFTPPVKKDKLKKIHAKQKPL